MKNKKGFTLIELLVVVAIIGILAAVGTVAYQGYTSGAKKNATKSNHASAVKYIAAELQKCAMGESSIMKKGTNTLACTAVGGTNASNTVANGVVTALSDFKNPFNTSAAAISVGAITQGITQVTDDTSTVTIITCFDLSVAGTDAACDNSATSTTSLTNAVDIE